MRMSNEDKPIARSSHEFLYTLMVKASTFSIYVDTNNTRMESEGSLLIRFLSTDLLEPDELLQTMHSYPCLGNVEFLRWGIKPGSKKERNLAALYQRRCCHPHSFHFVEILAQVDCYCATGVASARDEAEYVKHNLHENYESGFQTVDSRLFAYRQEYDRTSSFLYGVEQAPFDRYAFDIFFLVGIAKE
jgi:hypothetical protein